MISGNFKRLTGLLFILPRLRNSKYLSLISRNINERSDYPSKGKVLWCPTSLPASRVSTISLFILLVLQLDDRHRHGHGAEHAVRGRDVLAVLQVWAEVPLRLTGGRLPGRQHTGAPARLQASRIRKLRTKIRY